MTKQQYFEFAEQFFGKCLEISKAKNADYTGGAADPFANFKAVEILGISTEQGFLTRMMDKMKRISSFAEKGELQVKDESVTDTLRDLANYACLLAGYTESKKETVIVGDSVKGEALIWANPELKTKIRDKAEQLCKNTCCTSNVLGQCKASAVLFEMCIDRI